MRMLDCILYQFQNNPETLHHSLSTADGHIVGVDVNFKVSSGSHGQLNHSQNISNNNIQEGGRNGGYSMRNNPNHQDHYAHPGMNGMGPPGSGTQTNSLPSSYTQPSRLAFQDPYSPQVSYIFSGANSAGKALAYQEELGTHLYPVGTDDFLVIVDVYRSTKSNSSLLHAIILNTSTTRLTS